MDTIIEQATKWFSSLSKVQQQGYEAEFELYRFPTVAEQVAIYNKIFNSPKWETIKWTPEARLKRINELAAYGRNYSLSYSQTMNLLDTINFLTYESEIFLNDNERKLTVESLTKLK